MAAITPRGFRRFAAFLNLFWLIATCAIWILPDNRGAAMELWSLMVVGLSIVVPIVSILALLHEPATDTVKP
jgi:hypothetical protein